MIKVLALTIAAILAMSTIAEAKHSHRHHYNHSRVYNHHSHHHAHRGGSCDGIHRCRCGSTQAHDFGLPRIYKGFNLWLASEWARAFPHTAFHVGAVGVKPGHVLRVVGGSDCAAATVHDDHGTYNRNVCRMTFVSVNG